MGDLLHGRSSPAEGVSPNHWTMEKYVERMSAKQWRGVLLNGQDTLIVGGNLRQLVAKNLGYGVVEVSKEPYEQEGKDGGAGRERGDPC